MKKKILYIGGFEMPDKNAAAQRVMSISKALRKAGFIISFYGITKSGDIKGSAEGFEYEALPYPSGTKAWFKYASGNGIIEYIKNKNPNYVFTYNYPAVAQEKVIRFCHKNGIKVAGDITEWYMPSDIVRRIDTALRMRWSNKHLDGIIAISKFLKDYYRNNNTIQLPPLIDIEEPKWNQKLNRETSRKINLIYAGQPGYSKDRLDYIVKGIACVPHSNLILNIVGVTEEEYIGIFGNEIDLTNLPVIFHGRLPHVDTVRLLMESDFQVFFRPNIRVNNAGFPTKYVEAMAAGVPVITNRISNVDDYLKDGFNGIMIEHPFEGEIQDALGRVSGLERNTVEIMKSNCKRELFDYRHYTNDLMDFINRM